MELKTFIFEAGITRTRAAKDLGVTLQYISRVIRKDIRPSLELAKKIESYTRGLVTVEELVHTWETPNKPDPLEEYFKRKKLVA